MKISDLKVGENVTITLLVKTATTRLTKPPGNKPYLALELTDGRSAISGNHWDYGAGDPPAKNTILDVVAQVSEWAGNKQLNIKSVKTNETASVAEFAPNGDFELDDYVSLAKALIDEVTNEHVKGILGRAFNDNAALWKTIPSAKGIHHAFVAGNLKHSVDVALKAKALAQVMPGSNVDLCIAGGLLQDLGKLWTYEFQGAVIEMTLQGQLIEHIMIGAIKLEAYRTPENSKIVDLLQHIISSHHMQVEYGSPTTPQSLEALIVATADGLDARAQTIYEAMSKTKFGDVQTDRIYTMNNRPVLTIDYVKEVMEC